MKAILIGRHKPSGKEGFQIVRQDDINFPATSQECNKVLKSLLEDALKLKAALIFQMMPGQVAVACANIIGDNVDYSIGVIVNKPGERPAGIRKTFCFGSFEPGATHDGTAVDALKFANPRAKIETDDVGNVTITVDPPLRFEFSHIEWFQV